MAEADVALHGVDTKTKEQHSEHVDEELNDIANSEEHELGFFATIRKRPKLFAWCLWAVFTCLNVSFENQAAGIVLSIPEFRKDFGHYYEGDYELYTNWQSAFYGGPLAATIIGTLVGAVVADKIGRQIMLGVFLLVSFAAVALEFTATTNPWFFGGKLVNGAATGVLWSVAMAYIGEVYPSSIVHQRWTHPC
jgi:MFS transporter, SP family, general alpha glucoside:H+ symporter